MTMDFEFDRTKMKKRRLSDRETPNLEWSEETPAKRLEALEFLRRSYVENSYATETIQRVHRITREARG